MTWDPRPIPEVNVETEEFWSEAADERLLLCECNDCGLIYHYPRAICPDCFSDDIDYIESDGVGEVYSYSYTEKMEGWPDSKLPVIVAYVELDEGPRMMTNIIDVNPADLNVGTRVEVCFESVEDEEISVPVFTVAEK
jgi:uncharacterized OB-fold protein